MHNGRTDKNRRSLNFKDPKIKEVLPEYFAASYPKFIKLLERYYEFEKLDDTTELLYHMFQNRDITETDISLLDFIEDELLLGQSYYQGFPDKRAAANFSSILFRTKGSRYSIEWFFRSFYGVDPEVFYTKEDIFKIGESDSTIGANSLKYLHNDKLYQTFALLVRSEIPIDQWKEMFKLFVHPAGMYLGGTVLIEQLSNNSQVSGEAGVEQRLTPAYVFTGSTVDEGLPLTVTVTGTNLLTTNLFYYVEHVTTDNDDFDSPPNTDINNMSAMVISSPTGGETLTYNMSWDLDQENPPADGSPPHGETFRVHFYDGPNATTARNLGFATCGVQDVLPTYTVVANDAEVVEGTTTTFTITQITPPGAFDSVVGYENFDYTISGGSVARNISPAQGSTHTISAADFLLAESGGSASVTINLTSDLPAIPYSDNLEGNETITISGQGVASLNVASDTFLMKDPPAPTYLLEANDETVVEGTTTTFTVTQQNTPGYEDFTYEISGADAARNISPAQSPTTHTISAQDFFDNAGAVTIDITSTADFGLQGDETITISGEGAVTTNTASDTFVMQDQPPATYTVTAADASIIEGASTSFTIVQSTVGYEDFVYTITGASTARTINAGSTTITAADFTNATPTPGTVVVTVNSTLSDIYEGLETCTLAGTGSSSGNAGSDSFDCVDAATVYDLEPSATTVAENSGSTITFDLGASASNIPDGSYTFWLIAPSSGTVVTFTGAGREVEYDGGDAPISSAKLPVTITSNQISQVNGFAATNIPIDILDDLAVDGDKGFRGRLGDAGGSTLDTSDDVSVTDNDSITYTITTFSDAGRTTSSTSFTEGDTIYGRVATSAFAGETVTVEFTANSDTRLAGGTSPSNIDTFTNSAAGNYDFSYLITNSNVYEGDPSVSIQASSVQGSNTHAISIADQNEAYTAGSFADASIPEDGATSTSYTVTGTNIPNGTTVGYNISGTGITAGDFELSLNNSDWFAGDLSVAQGDGLAIVMNSNSGTVYIRALADAAESGNETLTLTLTSDSLGNTTIGLADDVIITNDSPGVSYDSFTVTSSVGSDDSINEDGTEVATFTLNSSNVTNGTTVGYTISGTNITTGDFQISLDGSTGWTTLGSLTVGNGDTFAFNMQSNTDSIYIRAVADATTESTPSPEVLTITLDATDSNGDGTGSLVETVNIVDTSQTALNFAFSPTDMTNRYRNMVSGGNVTSTVTLFNNGDATAVNTLQDLSSGNATGDPGDSITSPVTADEWTDAANHTAGFGDNYQIQVNVYEDNTKAARMAGNNTRSSDLPNSPPNNGSYDTVFLIKGSTVLNGNEAGVTNVQWEQDDASPAWFQMDEDIQIQMKCDVVNIISGSQLTQKDGYIEFIIKEYSGTLGTGTTVLTAGFTFDLQAKND